MLLLKSLQKPVNFFIIKRTFCLIYFVEQTLEFITDSLLFDFSIFLVRLFFFIEILLHILPECHSLSRIELFNILVKP